MSYREYEKKEAARAKLTPGGALFAVDIGSKGAKRFIAAPSASGFVDWFLGQPANAQMHYEIIPDGVPIKLYFDVEFLHAENQGLSIDSVIALINDSVQRALGMPDLQPFQTDASNDKKASRHLAYPVVLPSKAHVKSVVMHVLGDLRKSGTAPVTHSAKGEICGIDTAVYDYEHNMRICYSYKLGDPGRKLVPIQQAVSKREAMQKSLISYFLDELPRVEWRCHPTASSGGVGKRARQDTGFEPDDEAQLDKIKAFVIAQWPDARVVGKGKRYKNVLQIALKPGVHCPNAKRVHKNNCTRFNVELPDGVGHLSCADPDCKAANRWGRFRVDL